MAKILHIDSAQDMIDTVRGILQEKGYEIISALSGRDGFEKLEREKPDLVLLDVMMLDMSGWDVFSKIMKVRKGQKVAFLSIIEVSERRKQQLKEAGLIEYIMKPFSIDEFVAKIKAMVKA